MKATELKKGNIYILNYPGRIYLMLLKDIVGNCTKASYITYEHKQFIETNNLVESNRDYDYREATSVEKAHLQACIAAGTYVEPIKTPKYVIY